MKPLTIYIGVKAHGDKKIQIYKSLRLDLFHRRENVVNLLSEWIDEISEEYEEECYDYEEDEL